MSFQARRELLNRVAPRYREAGRRDKSLILDEFVASTGYARKHAIRLLSGLLAAPAPIRRQRPPRYGPAVQQALAVAWTAANGICAKRLVPFLPELVPALERHGHTSLTDDARDQLLSLSPATADRILRPLREKTRPRGISTTRRGRLLKRQVPVRTFAEWDDARPGFFEADLVAHCGGNVSDSFLYTLVLTDVATGWTECLPMLYRGQDAVLQALRIARQLLPFPMLGMDCDNGSEFLNQEVIAYCEREGITFTRGRAYRKNDQCFVEQKNGSVVRQFVGYDRFSGDRAHRQLNEVYRALRLYVNFFQPSVKLLDKTRQGDQVHRSYSPARTPFQRLMAAGVLGADTGKRLTSIYQALDPVALLRQVEALQSALWRHREDGSKKQGQADPETAGTFQPTVQFATHGGNVFSENEGQHIAARPPKPTKYQRTEKPRAPRTWRTRADPFEEVWEEVKGWLNANPERTAKSMFLELQSRYPDCYVAGQLRTLQRRVKVWRAEALLEFNDEWLREELFVGAELPLPLRASTPTPESVTSAVE